MNPSCCACDSPVTRVCKHPKCSFPPFCCEGPCTKGISQLMHTHDGQQDFIPYKDFQEKIGQVKSFLDPHSLHGDYLEQVKKDVQMLKDHLMNQIQKLDEMFEQLSSDLINKTKIELSQEGEEIIRKIDQQQNTRLQGMDICELLTDQLDYFKSKTVWAKIDCIKKGFAEGMNKANLWDMESLFINYDQRMEKSKALHDEGDVLRQQQKYKQALQKYQRALEFNSWDYLLHFQRGYCVRRLNELDEAQKSYKRSLELNPHNSTTLNNIGFIYQTRGDFQQAVEWYTRAIVKNKECEDHFSNRAQCYFKLKRYQQALTDYSTALKLKPNTKWYTEKIAQIAQLMTMELK